MNISNKFSITNNIQKIIDNLDIAIAVFGFLVSFVLIALYFLVSATMMILVIGLALLAISPTYLIWRLREILLDKNSSIEEQNSKGFFNTINDTTPFCQPVVGKMGGIIYWLCITFAFIALLAVPNNRSVFYFAFFAFAAGGISLSILAAKSKLQTVFILIKIVFLGLLARLSKICFFDSYGNDNLGHMVSNEIIAQTGNLNSILGLDAIKEVSYPIMHINVAISDIITGLPIKEATTIGLQLPVVISFVCVFLFATLFFGKRIGLFSALIVTTTDYLLNGSYGTTDFGCCIFFFIVFVLGKCLQSKSSLIWDGLFVLLAILLVETHAVSSAVMLITLIAFFIGRLMYNILYKNREFPIREFGYCVIFTLVIAIRSIYLISSDYVLFNSVVGPFLDRMFQGLVGLTMRVDTISKSLGFSEPTWSVFIDSLGFLILVSICIFAMYIWLQKRNVKSVVWIVIVSFLILQFVTYVFPFVGLRSIMPSRWFQFMYFFFAIMAGAVLVYLICKNKKWRFAIPVVIVVLTFCMVSGSAANNDSPIISQDYRESHVFTFEEAAIAETLTKYNGWKIMSDYRYVLPVVQRKYGYYNLSITSNFIDNTVPDVYDRAIIWREYTLTRPITLSINVDGRTLIQYSILGEEFRDGLDNKYHLMYDVGGARGYYR